MSADFDKAYGLPKKRPEGNITIPLATYLDMVAKIERLQQQADHDSWRTNPDRMGS
jgi:hypothetical protein